MRPLTLVLRSLVHYRRTHVAALLGVATAVAVLGGALVVGDSVRASLRDLVLRRLGATTHALLSPRFFAEDLAERASAAGGPGLRSCPLIVQRGTVSEAASERRASNVFVYGVDARFFAFHGAADPGLGPREALVSEALAAELGTRAGATVLVRVERAEDVSAATLFGRRDDRGRTLRLQVKAVASGALGEFALAPGQQAVKAVFVPLPLVQRTLVREKQANTLLFAEAAEGALGVATAVERAAGLEDLGVRVRALPALGVLAVENESGLLDDALVASARSAADGLSWASTPVLTYLANSLKIGGREVPYSLVAGLAPPALQELTGKGAAASADAIVLGEWAAHDLDARPGDTVSLDYYLWREEGAIETRTARFTVAATVPLAGPAADRDLAPPYPGITDSLRLSDWDPPFPIDLDKVRPRDEDYWRDHRTTPKAFVPLARAEELWGHRLGRASSIRIRPAPGMALEEARSRYAAALRGALDPAHFGLSVRAVRTEGLAAAEGSTDFGEYFVYFSFFLVVSALLLAGLFFRLGVEQRLAEVGLLEAVGFSARRIRGQFLAEGLAVAGLGSAIGAALAGGYAQLVLLGLRTIWRGAVGTDRLVLHVGVSALASAILGGLVTATLVIIGALRTLRGLSPRALLSGGLRSATQARRARRRAAVAAWGFAGLGAGLVLGAAAGRVPAEAAFFGAGACLLAAGLSLAWHELTGRAHSPIAGLCRPRPPQRVAPARPQPAVHRPRGRGQLRGRGRGRVPTRCRGRDRSPVGSGRPYPARRVSPAAQLCLRHADRPRGPEPRGCRGGQGSRRCARHSLPAEARRRRELPEPLPAPEPAGARGPPRFPEERALPVRRGESGDAGAGGPPLARSRATVRRRGHPRDRRPELDRLRAPPQARRGRRGERRPGSRPPPAGGGPSGRASSRAS